jgi:hypothetical protein
MTITSVVTQGTRTRTISTYSQEGGTSPTGVDADPSRE